MKIAIPTIEKNLVAEHFGRCPAYTILNENGKFQETLANTSSHMGGQGLPPELLQQNGINVLLCKGIGPRALQMCQKFQIDIYVDSSRTIEDIFNKWKSNGIEQASLNDVCEEHRS